jgi:tetratricopeptide (TPR) repeat protein
MADCLLYNKALELEPNSLEAWGGKGMLFWSAYRYQEAIECFEKFIELQPSISFYYWIFEI